MVLFHICEKHVLNAVYGHQESRLKPVCVCKSKHYVMFTLGELRSGL